MNCMYVCLCVHESLSLTRHMIVCECLSLSNNINAASEHKHTCQKAPTIKKLNLQELSLCKCVMKRTHVMCVCLCAWGCVCACVCVCVCVCECVCLYIDT